MNTQKIGEVQGGLVTVDNELQYWNEIFGQDFDGYIVQKSKGYIDLYGFYGIPSNDGLCYYVGSF
jgi:hypothetical protein